MPTPKKIRLDQLLVERGLAESRTKAQAMIMAGEIRVSNKENIKAGMNVPTDQEIQLKHEGPRYVSRGGIKLAGALDELNIDPTGWTCLDIGASTGGFTDCLLQRGAKQVFAFDVGKGQLHEKLKEDPRVTWKESFHVKELTPEQISQPIDLAVVDVSFISLRKVLPHVIPCIRPGGHLLALIKPQFEATRKEVAGSGVLKDEGRRQEIIAALKEFAKSDLELTQIQTQDAVISGPKGNQETFLSAIRTLNPSI